MTILLKDVINEKRRPGLSRIRLNTSTSSLSNNTNSYVDLSGPKTYAIISVTSNVESRIRLYINDSSRTADVSRSISVTPSANAGVVADFRTTNINQTLYISPGIIGFNENSVIHLTVTNLSNSNSVVSVQFNMIEIEE